MSNTLLQFAVSEVASCHTTLWLLLCSSETTAHGSSSPLSLDRKPNWLQALWELNLNHFFHCSKEAKWGATEERIASFACKFQFGSQHWHCSLTRCLFFWRHKHVLSAFRLETELTVLMRRVALVKGEAMHIVRLEPSEALYYCIPSLLVQELEISRHIITLGTHQDTAGKAVSRYMCFLLSCQSSHAGRQPHGVACLSSLSNTKKWVSPAPRYLLQAQ